MAGILVERGLTVRSFLGMEDDELAVVDPVVMNLVVAKGIPALANIDIERYVAMADGWAADLRRNLAQADENFRRAPENWKHDIDFSRLAFVCWYFAHGDRILFCGETEENAF